MSKEKKNRFYYSKKQSEIDEEMWNMPTRFTFVKTPDGWKQYSEWCSVKSAKCNWEDAKLVYETDDEPEVIIHECIPELIADLEAKLAEYEEIMKKHNIVGISKLDAYLTDYLDVNEETMSGKIIKQLKQQLVEKDKELKELRFQARNIFPLVENLEDKVNQDKISFCIDKLEKVRNNIKKVPITDYEPNEHFEKMYKSDAIRQIDNQIKQLKGEK